MSSPDVNWWTGVVWTIVMFLSAVWTLILTAPIHIHCWDTDAVTFLQTWWRNKLILISDELRVNTFTAHFHFWVNYSFNASCLVLIQLSIKYLIKMTRNRAADLSHAVNLFQVKCIALYIWQRVFKHTQHSRNAPHILQERVWY